MWNIYLKKFAFYYSSAFLLCCVVVLQGYWQKAYGIIPWKGGGFAMFSTVDHQNARVVRIYLILPDKEIPVLIPENFGLSLRRFVFQATPQNLQAVALRIGKYKWVSTESLMKHPGGAIQDFSVLIGKDYYPVEPKEVIPGMDVLAVTGIRLEYWQKYFDGATDTIGMKKMFDVTQSVRRNQ